MLMLDIVIDSPSIFSARILEFSSILKFRLENVYFNGK